MKETLILIAGFVLYLFLYKRDSESKPAFSKGQIIERIKFYSEKYNLDSAFVQAIVEQESMYNPNAVNPADPSYGLMQLTMPTAKFYNKSIKSKEDLMDIENNLQAGTRFIQELFRKYPTASKDDIAQMYNIGETKFRRNIRNPKYSQSVMERYSKIKGGLTR